MPHVQPEWQRSAGDKEQQQIVCRIQRVRWIPPHIRRRKMVINATQESHIAVTNGKASTVEISSPTNAIVFRTSFVIVAYATGLLPVRNANHQVIPISKRPIK